MKINVIRIYGVVGGRVEILDFNAKECPPDFISWYCNAIGMVATDWYAYTNSLDWVPLMGGDTVPVEVGKIRPYCIPHKRGMVPSESYASYCAKRAKKQGKKRAARN